MLEIQDGEGRTSITVCIAFVNRTGCLFIERELGFLFYNLCTTVAPNGIKRLLFELIF